MTNVTPRLENGFHSLKQTILQLLLRCLQQASCSHLMNIVSIFSAKNFVPWSPEKFSIASSKMTVPTQKEVRVQVGKFIIRFAEKIMFPRWNLKYT